MADFVVRPGSKRSLMIKDQQATIDQCKAQIAEFAKWLAEDPMNITDADQQTKVAAVYRDAKNLQESLILGYSLADIVDEIRTYIIDISQKRITPATAHQRWLTEFIGYRAKTYERLMKLINKGTTNID